MTGTMASTRPGARAARGAARGAFTLLELMVVVAIIVILVGILAAALGGAFRTSQTAMAERHLGAIAQAIEHFKADLTYYPPLLSVDNVKLGETPPDRSTVTVPESRGNPVAALRETRFGSEYSLGVYLLGAGDINGKKPGGGNSDIPNVGANDDQDDGAGGPGFRAPGADRSWGGAVDRNQHNAPKLGRVYGPYLDPAQLSNFIAVEPQTGLFKVLDGWGQPVRYYMNWPVRDGVGGKSSVDRTPVELRSAEAVEQQINSAAVDLGLERPALTAPFMLVSAGKPVELTPDGRPVPHFGDRYQSSLSTDFNPSSLTPEDRLGLLEDLTSNIRVVP